jgi:hypothetical protein
MNNDVGDFNELQNNDDTQNVLKISKEGKTSIEEFQQNIFKS